MFWKEDTCFIHKEHSGINVINDEPEKKLNLIFFLYFLREWAEASKIYQFFYLCAKEIYLTHLALEYFKELTFKKKSKCNFIQSEAATRGVQWKRCFFWHRFFPVNFAEFLRTPILRNTSGWLFCTVMSQRLGRIKSQD